MTITSKLEDERKKIVERYKSEPRYDRDYPYGELNGFDISNNLWKTAIKDDMDNCDNKIKCILSERTFTDEEYEECKKTYGCYECKQHIRICKDVPLNQKCPACQRDARRIKEKD